MRESPSVKFHDFKKYFMKNYQRDEEKSYKMSMAKQPDESMKEQRSFCTKLSKNIQEKLLLFVPMWLCSKSCKK